MLYSQLHFLLCSRVLRQNFLHVGCVHRRQVDKLILRPSRNVFEYLDASQWRPKSIAASWVKVPTVFECRSLPHVFRQRCAHDETSTVLKGNTLGCLGVEITEVSWREQKLEDTHKKRKAHSKKLLNHKAEEINKRRQHLSERGRLWTRSNTHKCPGQEPSYRWSQHTLTPKLPSHDKQ